MELIDLFLMHLNYRTKLNENNWYIDVKNNFAHWYIYSNGANIESFWGELTSLLNVIFHYGNLSKLFYSNDYIIEPAKILVSDLKSSDNDEFNGVFKMVKQSRLNSLVDLYQKGEIVSKEINSLNIESILNEVEYCAIAEISQFNFSLLELSYDINTSVGRFTIGLHINSDIFFPFVLCPWKWKKKYDDNDEIGPGRNELDYKIHGFDNIELSYRNGSRLNLMIKGLKSYVDRSDEVQWDFYKTEHWPGYHKMVSDSGIILEKENL